MPSIIKPLKKRKRRYHQKPPMPQSKRWGKVVITYKEKVKDDM